MPTLKQLFGTPCELSELANYGVNSGVQDDLPKSRTCELGELVYDDTHPSSQSSQSSQTIETSCNPMNTGMFASSQSSQGHIAENNAANEDGTDDAATFWHGFMERVDECDRLIRQLCDRRGDSDAHRADLLAIRMRMAPANVDSDIKYLMDEIERVTPTSLPEPMRDCRDCDHHRGRNNNVVRYCVSPDGAAQRDDAVASVIVDRSVATRCKAFRRPTP